MKRKLKYLKVKGEPVYIVINNEVLEECYEEPMLGYVYPNREKNIIYLPTKKHIRKFIIKHEYYHLKHDKYMGYGFDMCLCSYMCDEERYDISSRDFNAMLYAGEIYKNGDNYHMKDYISKEIDKLRDCLKERYLKLKKKEMANKEIDT